MDTPLTGQYTPGAPARLPRITANELAGLVQTCLLDEPAAAARIERGVALLLAGRLLNTATLGVYTALGQDDRTYVTTSLRCTCPDATVRGRLCKHSWAAMILSAASAIAAFEDRQARYALTRTGARALELA